MDKNWKLQRYGRKDYTEVVEFPVEIVGRDGVVRRYTFEDSIRLYQRRITFAPIRYRDDDLVDAEVVHCRSRIGQLRQSYFHRFGWGTPEGMPEPADVFEELAGEVAAFLCRVLRSEGRPAVRFERVGSPDDTATSTWFLSPDDGSHSMLLYVHRFRGLTADAVRDRFFTALRRLELAAPFGGDSERLLAFHHSVDCGFVLTGRADEFTDLLPTAAQSSAPAQPETVVTPWDEAMELIRRGRHEEALVACKAVVGQQPWHRRAYVAGAMVAMHLDRHDVAEEFALVGSRYYPEDAILHYYAGVARLRDGRDEGAPSIRRALELGPTMMAARAALLVYLVEHGEHREALEVLADRPRAAADADPSDEEAMVWMERLLRVRPVVVGGVVTCAALALVLVYFTWLAVLLLVGAAIAGGALRYGLHRQLKTLNSRQQADEIRRGLKRLAREQVPAAN